MNEKTYQSHQDGTELFQWQKSMTYLPQTCLRLSEEFYDYVLLVLLSLGLMHLFPSVSTWVSAISNALQ